MKQTKIRPLTKLSIGLLVLLTIQYVLGMLINLYVQFPANASVEQDWEFMHTQWLMWAHIINGMLIILGTIALYIRALRLKDKTWKIAGGIASGSVILAFISGEEFVSRQLPILSFSMSLFFILAFISLVAGLYRTKTSG